jgi:ubiquinone/menaquinone biosynthesis C-methylase UbiE
MRYLTDEEYEVYWHELGGVRDSIALDLVKESSTILDVACGWGYYTFRLTEYNPSGIVVALDLVPSAFTNMKGKQTDLNTIRNIEPVISDATRLPFRTCVFDISTSFLGMRDIYMTLGRRGVEKTVKEMTRTTRRTGRIAICVTPPNLADTDDLQVAIEVEGEIFGAKSLPTTFYEKLYQKLDVHLLGIKAYCTGSKMTATQTRKELVDGIRIARNTYSREVSDFEEVWRRYGPRIEKHGYGMYSKVAVIIGKRS